VGSAHHDSLVVGPRDHPLEAEADRIADRIVGAPTAGSSAARLQVHRVSESAGSNGDRAPASVAHLLERPARSLDPALRSDLEQRFGQSLSRVRVHTDAAAAQSAAEVGARAYAVGDDIVFGGGQFAPGTAEGRRLIAHEVAHVLQQSGSRACVQRASPATGLGLDQPDCSTRVMDVFWLGPTYFDPARPECGFAEIHLLKEMSRSGVVRADYPLPKTPCEEGDTRSHGTWLRYGSNEWRVLEIRNEGVDVMNACGEEETLGLAGQPPPTPAPGPPPEHTVKVADSNFGPGTVLTYDGCQRVEFIPDIPGETRSWALEVLEQRGMPGVFKVYVPENGEKIRYAPMDLAGMLRVYLLGENCGQPLPPPEPEPATGLITE
jgi:hypothetical protein